jgi:PIN domain nuclease of toxin-antitoxin system
VIVLDTHAWVWALDAPEHLTVAARDAIETAEQIIVSPISAFEIATLVARGRLGLDRDVGDWLSQALAAPRVAEQPVTSTIAARAGVLDRERFPGDPADRLIYATARHRRCRLVTRDRALRAFDPDGTVW